MAKRTQQRQFNSQRAYKDFVKQHRDLFPSFQKYDLRRNLTRGQKSAITKAARHFDEIRDRGINPAGLSKSQAKRLRDKSTIIGSREGIPGIRAVPSLPESSARVDSDGQLHFERGQQEWTVINVDFAQEAPDLRNDVMQAIRQIRQTLGNGPIQLGLWQAHGISDPSGVFDFSEDELFADEVVDAAEQYEQSESFMHGIMGAAINA